MNFDAIDTPAVLVDLDKAEANIRAFQSYADQHGLKVRPHIKTHKLPLLAAYQVAQGAVGITCQKVSEAEAMIAGGEVTDVMLTYNILGAQKLRRLRELSEKVRLSVVADNLVVAQGLSGAFQDAAAPLDVLVECNTGADRCGVSTPEEARDLAAAIEALPGIHFVGLMTYPPMRKPEAVADWLDRAKALIEAAGITVPVISSGGSPDIWKAQKMPLANEYRVGTYAYNDGFLVGQGTCTWDECALTVLATVVSVPAANRAVIDAGSKVLTSDLLGLENHGHVLGRPDLAIDQLSEEHGRIVSEGPINLSVGQRVRIVPNHACVVSNMLDQVELVRGETHIGSTPVVARGKVW